MADYWKSQPRKFCQYCKCWIADNKPSVEFHERGKNHKENVAAKITEIKKKSIDKAKQEQKACKQFAAMEEAAMKAYQEDLKRMEREAAGLDSPDQTTTGTTTTTTQQQQQPPTRAKPPRKEKANRRPRNQMETEVWVEGQTDDGHTYYYNSITGESRWEKPGESSASAQPPPTESSSGCPWMEATSPDGYTYYYNTETGESSWEKPADFLSKEASESGSSRETGGPEEPATPQPEPLSGGEDSLGGAPASQENEVPEQADQQPSIPKISFRKRKAETELSELEDGEDKVGDEAPKDIAEGVNKEEEAQNTTAEPVEEKEEKPAPETRRGKRSKAANPYGVWEQIQEEDDPYSSVDLQLPQMEASAPVDLPPQPKPKFKERVITSLGDEGGPATFRKNKTQNGKSRSLRQRDDDDD